jgi:hypothetical protein
MQPIRHRLIALYLYNLQLSLKELLHHFAKARHASHQNKRLVKKKAMSVESGLILLVWKYLNWTIDKPIKQRNDENWAKIMFHSLILNCLTVCVIGGWGEKGLETENCQSPEKAQKTR